MKLTSSHNTKATKSGMTLLELTVVILVLLSLISILFIGARAWKKGSDRAASILQIRNAQQAVRSYANMNGKNPGEPDANVVTEVFGPGKFIETNPVGSAHPAGSSVSYIYGPAGTTNIPILGHLFIEADDAQYMPEAGTYDAW
jgi:prepilin-type N-terminal cleavage/methylation domain-containing protein